MFSSVVHDIHEPSLLMWSTRVKVEKRRKLSTWFLPFQFNSLFNWPLLRVLPNNSATCSSYFALFLFHLISLFLLCSLAIFIISFNVSTLLNIDIHSIYGNNLLNHFSSHFFINPFGDQQKALKFNSSMLTLWILSLTSRHVRIEISIFNRKPKKVQRLDEVTLQNQVYRDYHLQLYSTWSTFLTATWNWLLVELESIILKRSEKNVFNSTFAIHVVKIRWWRWR